MLVEDAIPTQDKAQGLDVGRQVQQVKPERLGKPVNQAMQVALLPHYVIPFLAGQAETQALLEPQAMAERVDRAGL